MVDRYGTACCGLLAEVAGVEDYGGGCGGEIGRGGVEGGQDVGRVRDEGCEGEAGCFGVHGEREGGVEVGVGGGECAGEVGLEGFEWLVVAMV